MRIQLQPAYLLHRRAYRDNSELIDVLTAEHGRLGAVARGLGRKRSGGPLAAVLQPFRPLLASFSGRGDLLTLTAVESGGDLPPLTGEALLCGFYLNEVLVRVLERFDSHPRIFVAYGRALEDLGQAKTGAEQALALRRCEFELLEELGYAVDFRHTWKTGEAICPDRRYRIVVGDGLVAEADAEPSDDAVFRGEDLLAVADRRFEDANGVALKKMSRLLLATHLGSQPLRSQAVFRGLRSPGDRA